jgi:2-polyprenyl-3-methyl-5-hydroxy-6-metoxy-1,4-benzoquinol methylase
MQFTIKDFKKRVIRRLGDVGIRVSKWGNWEGLDAASEIPRYSNIENWRMEYKPSGSVLDVGCGSGIMLDTIHKSNSSNVRYCGIDRSRGAITLANTKILNEELEIFIRGDIWNVSQLKKELFDFIIFNEVLYYLDAPIELIEKYKNLLKENGFFLLSIYKNFQADPGNRWDETWKRVHSAYENQCIKTIFVESGENYGWHQGLYSKSVS